MPSDPTIGVFDSLRITSLYDPGAVTRGTAYASEGRATLLDLAPGRLRSVVRGSGRATYLVTITWQVHGERLTVDDTCTCPIGGGCKHCVATILTARQQEQELRADTTPTGGADWRRVLGDLDRSDDHDPTRTDLALQFTVVHRKPSQYEPDPDPRVSIRPMRIGKSGHWVKTGASWRDIEARYGATIEAADPRQLGALRALLAATRSNWYASGDTMVLSQFGPELWYELDRAVDAGVELVTGRANELVELSTTPAGVRVDLTAAPSGGVTVTATLAIGDEPLAVGGGLGALVGTPAHGVWTHHDGRLLLAPFATPLHPSVRRLVVDGSVVVPEDDVDELLDVYQPELARHATVASSDRSVTFTAIELDAIVLTVERPKPDVASLRWSVSYRRGERRVLHELHHPGGRTRDRVAEQQAILALDLATDPLAGLLPHLVDPAGIPRDTTLAGMEVVTLHTEVLPWLEERGVEVLVAGDLPALHGEAGDPTIAFEVSDDERAEGTDWFDLDVEVSVEGERVDFASLFAALDRGDEVLILSSGAWLRLDRPELVRLRELISEARGLADPARDGATRLNRFQASWWDELAGLGVVREQSQRWTENVARMSAISAPEAVAPPAGLDATLRHYQQEGLDWLVFLHRNRLGGILADDMGLGKTVQTLALCLHVLEEDPTARFLVVAPTSVVENWAREAARFAPGLVVRIIGETAKRRGTPLDETIEGANLVVTSYALFRLEFDAYAEHDWELLLLDEAQFVKNHTGKTYQCARRLDAATKIAITGTPLENSLMDLWALLSITAPGLFPDPKRFDRTYRKPIEKGGAPELLATLRRRIAPLMRRRTKDAVLTELPPKTEQTVPIELSARHARIYATQLQRERQKVLGLVDDVQRNRFEILRSLTLLRQLALDPGLVDEEHDGVGSAKLDRLMDDLATVLDEGHRALVFSQFTRYLARVRHRLDEAGIDHAYLDGRTRRRDEAIARFKDGGAPVFVISIKAGGFGLNLTEADYCFVLDPWWNPATETQAIDRTHRIGQQNPVMVYRYVSTDTIEEKVMELKARKSGLFSSVVDAEGALAGAITGDDIAGLLDLGTGEA